MRRIAFALALLAGGSILLLWAAGVELGSPFAPAQYRQFLGSELTPVFGGATPADGRLHVDSAGQDEMSLQSLRPSYLDAEAFTTLRYRFAEFPRTLELSLVFRTLEHPDLVAVSLPWPGNATGTFDLSRVAAWHGRVVEIGFAEFPTAQIVPPAQGFQPFQIVDAELWSRSWRGSLAALSTDWFAAWPWTQRSVHALGRDTDTPRAEPIVGVVALAVALAIALAAAFFGWRARTFRTVVAVSVAAGWLLLDIVWQDGLWGRLQTTRAVYAGLSWQDRERTVADTAIADAAEHVKAMLRGEPEQTRILVYTGAENGYELLRFIWHLLPRNVGVYAYTIPFTDDLPDGCLIVFFDNDDWRSEKAWHKLLAHSDHLSSQDSIHGDGFDSGPVAVFRYHHARR